MFSSSRFYPCVPSPWIRCKTPQWTDWMLVQTFSSNAVFHTASLLSEGTPPVPASRGRKTSLVRQMFTHLRHTHTVETLPADHNSPSHSRSACKTTKKEMCECKLARKKNLYYCSWEMWQRDNHLQVEEHRGNPDNVHFMFIYLFFTKTALGSLLVLRKVLKLSSQRALKAHTHTMFSDCCFFF